MRRRKIKHGSNELVMKNKSFKEIPCSTCGESVEVDSSCESVICAVCVQKKVPVDPKLLIQKGAEKNGEHAKPRGWRFMKEFVDSDGTVYHSGKEVPELKGTLTPTDVTAIKAKQKEKSKDRKAHKAERAAKKEAKLLKEFEKKKRLKEKEEKQKAKEAKKRLEEQQ
jgi:hypothetical protein